MILSELANITPEIMDEYRKEAIRNVRRTRGKINFDDNVSGMTFNWKGLGGLENAGDEGKVEVVLVKDLSRLGRHRTQTALFIDHLRENKVKVISVTEGIDTTNENDDLLIGFKQIFNDFYAKDISKKFVPEFVRDRKTAD